METAMADELIYGKCLDLISTIYCLKFVIDLKYYIQEKNCKIKSPHNTTMLYYLCRSIGCTIVEMLTTKPPFSEFEPMTAIYNIGAGRIPPRIPGEISDALKDLLQQCFKRDPRFRPSATNLLSHPFFKMGRLSSSDSPENKGKSTSGEESSGSSEKKILDSLYTVKDKVKTFIQKCINKVRRIIRQCVL